MEAHVGFATRGRCFRSTLGNHFGFPLMTINYDVTKRGNLGKRASSDWLKVMSFMLKAKITRINANLEIPLLGAVCLDFNSVILF